MACGNRGVCDGAGNAAFDEIGCRAFADDHLGHDFRGQQCKADASSDGLDLVEHEPVARRNRMTVDERLREAWTRAAQAHAIVLVEAPFASSG